MKNKKQHPKWVRPRHTVVRWLLLLPLYLLCKLRYHIHIEKWEDSKNRPYLVIFNHQTAFDQFFVSLSFARHVYFISSEDLFSNGFTSALIKWLVAPIPFRKSTSDITALKNCLRIAREGGTIGMAPEGNRTYSGTTEYMKPAVASLAKALKLPLALYRIEGGYCVHPRWADTVRKAPMRAYVSRVVEPEEYAEMTNEALFELIDRELYVDDREQKLPIRGGHSAEYLERAMYVCPDCGLSEFYSEGDAIRCLRCGLQVRYLPDQRLEGIGKPFAHATIKDWYDAQCAFVRSLDLTPYQNEPLYRDSVLYSENLYCKRKIVLDRRAQLAVYADRFEVHAAGHTDVYPFEKVDAATVLGRNKLNIYVGKQIFQFKGSKRFNALKYLNLYCHANNVTKGDPYGGFLGL